MDEEDVEKIRAGFKHCVIGSGLSLQCLKCKTVYKCADNFPNGVPLWMMKGIAWAFSHEHSDCEDEE